MCEIVYIRSSGIFDDSRATKEIISLSKKLSKIHVLAWDRYGNAEEKNSEIFKEYDNVDFLYFKKLIPNGIGFKNIFKLFSWFNWVEKSLTKFKNIKAVHACDLDTGIPALRYCKKNDCKLIYDIYDYYIDSHHIPSFIEKIVEDKEIEVIDYADTTIICTEERREQISKANPKNVVVIYNAPNITRQENREIVYDYVYCGSLYSKRLINEILEEYEENSDLKFLFAGYGEYASKCRELAKKFSNFIYKESIPYKQVLEFESQSRCISAIYEPSIRNHRLCAPNKFYEALGLGKPIIVCKGTGIDEVVRDLQCGEIIDYSSSSFYKALRKVKETSNIKEVYNSSLEIEKYEKEFRWSLMEEKLSEIYSS